MKGKFYEYLLLQELIEVLIDYRKDIMVSENGGSADAINAVLKIARDVASYTHAHHSLCVVISLDVKNALNSSSWQYILGELRDRKINESLRNIITSYLSNKEIIIETEGKTQNNKN